MESAGTISLEAIGSGGFVKRIKMKKTAITLFAALCMMTASAQTTYFSCDFTGGIPSTFTMYDLDGLEPSGDVAKLGFKVGVPWVGVKLAKENNNTVACSTSWYKNSGQSNDWLVTPPIKVLNGNSVVSWVAKAADADFADGYSVYLSTDGPEPDKFDLSSPAFTVEAESAEWMKRTASLSEYTGKTVYVAFVNNSRDCSKLYIDNIFAGVRSNIYLLCGLDRVTGLSGEVPVSGTVVSDLDHEVRGCRISLESDGETVWQDFPDMVLRPGENTPFTLDSKIALAAGETKDYTLTVECGDDIYSNTYTITSLANRVLCDEFTGMWCGYCVRGIVMLDKMRAKYPDSFIGVAIHDNDKLECDDFIDAMSLVGAGLPWMAINRSKAYFGDPNEIERYYTLAMERKPEAGIEMDGSYDASSGEVSLTTTLTFAEDHEDAGYRLAYTVIENNVSDPSYYQNNSYSGSSADMGGWESLPAMVRDDLKFQEVARGISGGWEGIEGSVPASLVALSPVGHEWSFTLLETVMNAMETEVVAVLVNKKGEVANAMKLPVKEMKLTGVDSALEDNLRVFVGDGCIRLAGEEILSASLIDMSGKTVASSIGDTMDTSAVAAGVYVIVAGKADCGSSKRKIIIY